MSAPRSASRKRIGWCDDRELRWSTRAIQFELVTLMSIRGLHHVAVICSDYAKSKRFYVEVLGFAVVRESFRAERRSYKLDLAVPGGGMIELFSFPDPPARLTRPEACGLRHLALRVTDLDREIARLAALGVAAEAVRVDEYTGARFTFIADPDGLPIELNEELSA